MSGLISPAEARQLAAQLREGGWGNLGAALCAADTLEHLADLCERQQRMLNTLSGGGVPQGMLDPVPYEPQEVQSLDDEDCGRRQADADAEET